MPYFKAKENEARALLLNCPVSRKFGNEMARFIKGMSYAKAMAYIEAVIEKKRYLPLARFKGNVGHRPGIERKIKSGRYPKKLAIYFKKALELAKKNAENKGLDSEDLIIAGCVVNTGVRRITIQPGGRRRLRRTKSAHIEVLLRQKHKLKEKGAKKEDEKGVKVEDKKELEGKQKGAEVQEEKEARVGEEKEVEVGGKIKVKEKKEAKVGGKKKAKAQTKKAAPKSKK